MFNSACYLTLCYFSIVNWSGVFFMSRIPDTKNKTKTSQQHSIGGVKGQC